MITNAHWFAQEQLIGIVQIVQDHQKDDYRQTGQADFKYYIGVVGNSSGNEKMDAAYIADHGQLFDKSAGDALFGVQR